MFQSTHPHGMRLTFPAASAASLAVSIHAPTWDATRRRTTKAGR